MPEYLTRLHANAPLAGQSAHSHFGWEPPINSGNSRYFRVGRGSYQGGTLEVRMSATPEGEEGATLVFPPAYTETNPVTGTFTLAEVLEAGWDIQVKYISSPA